MRKLILAGLISAAALSAGASGLAIAQPYGGTNYGYDRNSFWQGAPNDAQQRIGWLQQRIERGARDGSLNRGEANRLQTELNQIRRMAYQMSARSGGRLYGPDQAAVQSRLDQLSQRVRWQRNDGQYGNQYGGQYGGQYANGAGRDPYTTDYDASRYYRDGPNYQERRLSSNDEVYRGSDGRYYCKRSDGTTGLIVGAAGGALLGNLIDGGRNRTASTLIGGALGALAGKSVEQNDVRCR